MPLAGASVERTYEVQRHSCLTVLGKRGGRVEKAMTITDACIIKKETLRMIMSMIMIIIELFE